MELCYLDPGHDQVRIEGRAEGVDDQAVRKEIWDTQSLAQELPRLD